MNSISGSDRREFEQEARLLSLPGVARDPNIAPVLGANMDENPSFVIREFSEQGDLAQVTFKKLRKYKALNLFLNSFFKTT